MKRTVWFLLVLLFSTSSIVEAANYVAVKGDSLTRISKKVQVKLPLLKELNKDTVKPPEYKVLIGQEIIVSGDDKKPDKISSSAKILKPKTKTIKPAQKTPAYMKDVLERLSAELLIPVEEFFLWVKPGGNKFRGVKALTLRKMDLTNAEIVEVMAKMLLGVGEKESRYISVGDYFDKMSFDYDTVKDHTVAAWDVKKHGNMQAAWVYTLSTGKEIWDPFICGNLSLRIPRQPKPEPEQPMPEPEPVVEEEFPPVPEYPSDDFPPVPEYPPVVDDDFGKNEVKVYVGGGIYESESFPASGHYEWAKVVDRFIWFEYDEMKIGLGVSLNLGAGAGHDDEYNYRWRRWWIGPNAKLIGNHYDVEFDFGWGKLKNTGGVSLYDSKQYDEILATNIHYNNYARRDAGKLMFPGFEGNFSYILPIHTSQKHSWDGNKLKEDPNDNTSLEFVYCQHLYDFRLDEFSRITPQFNLGGGRDFGLEMNFLQFGPRVTYATHGEDVVSINFLNYKKMFGDVSNQWHWLSITVDTFSAYKAIKRLTVKSLTPAEAAALGL